MAAARARVERSLARGRSTGKLDDEDVDRILAQLSFTDDVADLGDCDIAIEAIVERMPEKLVVFEHLDRVVPEHGILASNTSSLPIIEIARATRRADRVIGTHFFNPA